MGEETGGSGWISLLHLHSGFRWAEKIDKPGVKPQICKQAEDGAKKSEQGSNRADEKQGKLENSEECLGDSAAAKSEDHAAVEDLLNLDNEEVVDTHLIADQNQKATVKSP